MGQILRYTAPFLLLLGLLPLSSCSGGEPRLANELIFDLNGITEISVSYGGENITLREGGTPNLVVREYMTADRDSYHAKVTQRDGALQVSEGGKPLFGGFSRYVELYLPAAYCEALNLYSTSGVLSLGTVSSPLRVLEAGTTSGTVTLDGVTAAAVKLTTTSGSLKLGEITAPSIEIATTSGAVDCAVLDGAVSYATTSGSLSVASARGSGRYHASNSGKMEVCYTDITGDLVLHNKNDAIDLTIPSGLSFAFQADSKNGSITVPFRHSLTADGRSLCGAVGTAPAFSIQLDTHDGNIQVNQAMARESRG